MKKVTHNFFDRSQIHTLTNLDLVFVRQLNFTSDIVNEIKNYNYKPLLLSSSAGYSNFYEFDGGTVKIIGITDEEDSWDELGVSKPDYLEKIFNLIEAEWMNIDPEAKVGERFRTYLNIDEVKNARQSDIHHDVKTKWDQQWSAVVHLNDGTDGGTEFFNSMIFEEKILTVPFVPGQAIIFPSVYSHRGQVPTTNTRLVVNYMFTVETKLNDRVLKQ